MPLIVACRAGHMDICEMLLSHASKIDREGYLDRKFSVKQIGVIKNFSYKNLVRLHSRNKAQMQRQSFFLRAGGRSRFGAASETLVSGHHRISAPQREH